VTLLCLPSTGIMPPLARRGPTTTALGRRPGSELRDLSP